QDRPVAALADLDRALAAPPGGSDPAWHAISTAGVLGARGQVFLELDNPGGAEADARAMLALVSTGQPAAAAWELLAMVAMARGDFAAARAASQQVLDLDPDHLA